MRDNYSEAEEAQMQAKDERYNSQSEERAVLPEALGFENLMSNIMKTREVKR